MKFAHTDIDIDFKDRDEALKHLPHITASRIKDDKLMRHNTGVYLNNIPTDPLTGMASIDYKEAENRGYTKIDFLNISVYQEVRDDDHLQQLVDAEPVWELLLDEGVVTGKLTGKPIFQLHDQFEIVEKFKPKSIDDLAILLALMRPSKRHLIDEDRDVIEREIWAPDPNDEYTFKKAHSYSYALAIVVQLNLLAEQATATENEKPPSE